MLSLPQKTLELLLVRTGQVGLCVEPPLLPPAFLLQHVVVPGAAALEPALLAHFEAPGSALVGLHLRHVSSAFRFFYLRRGSRHGRKAVSPPSCARLVYQTVAYLRAALSLRPFAWGASAWDDSFLGAMTMTMLRPARLGWLSMRPSSLRSWSPILGLSFISRTLTLTCFLRASLRACSFWYFNLP